MSEEMKPTKGPWTLGCENNSCAEVCIGDSDLVFSISRESPYTSQMQISRAEMLANVHLVMEAGTVYHETGLTPREILAQRDELLKACGEFFGLGLDDGSEVRAIMERIQNTTPEPVTP